ncbi:MAG: HEAT repeat domain-containing protein [Candidatus Melainabacteria bacterium]|nr:HEAT repeat domain-containing protein [Candidatus Melainabacteria bacterium]
MGSDSDSGKFHDLSVYQNKSNFGLITEAFSSRPEQTLGGATIGIARDTFDKPDNAQQKFERAEENDMASHIAADTVAIVPKFRALTGGLVRATMLVNPHQGLQENLGAFTLNVGEGAALNTVGKTMLPGSRLQNTLARNISSPFAKEIATHLTVGGGFGLVKSGFDTSNWVDENGNFTPGKLATNVVKSTATGALINVPAGMVGVRVMKGAMSMMAAKEAPNRLATTIAAAGSGYTSGTVFGGIDAVSQGKSFNETLSAMHFAGKVGLVTGGFVGGLDNGALHAKHRAIVDNVLKANSLSVQENVPTARTEKAVARTADGAESPSQKKSRDQLSPEELASEMVSRDVKTSKADGLDFVVLNSKSSDLTPRLKNPRREVEVVHRLKPEAANKTFSTLEEFRANTQPTEVKMRVFDIEGHKAKLVVEESLLAKMQKNKATLAALEAVASKDIPFDTLPSNERRKISLQIQNTDPEPALVQQFGSAVGKESAVIMRARQALSTTPRLAQPEDFVALLDEVPNRAKIKRVVLSEEPNPEDPWNKVKFENADFESAATASKDGTITFYLTKNMSSDKGTLRTFMGHEFGHLAADNAPEEAALHYLAILVDKDVPNPKFDGTAGSASTKVVAADDAARAGLQFPEAPSDKPTDKHFSRRYARSNPDEDGAVHLGEEMLAPDSDRFLVFAENAPVRTVLLGRSLTRVVAQAAPTDQSTHARQISNRLGHVQKEVYPDALKLLERRTKHGTPTEQAAAAELLGHIGNRERHAPVLRRLASDPDSNVVPADLPGLTRNGSTAPVSTSRSGMPGLSFESSGKGRTVADIAFDNLLRLHSGSVHDQLALLVKEARPNSATRELALTRLGSSTHSSSPGYRKLAEMTGNADKLPELIDLMRNMPDVEGRMLVFHEAYGLGRNSPEFTRSLVARGLELPGVAAQALELMPPQDAAIFEPQLRKLTRQTWDKPAHDKANQILSDLAAGTDVGRVMQLLRSDNPKGVQQGIDIVIASKSADNRLIEPLVEVANTAPEATSRAARQALLRFNAQLVKFHSQMVTRRSLHENHGAN